MKTESLIHALIVANAKLIHTESTEANVEWIRLPRDVYDRFMSIARARVESMLTQDQRAAISVSR